MDIEIKQLLSQVVAFLLMLWILKRLAWKPLLALMDERQRSIEEQFESIEMEKQKIAELNTAYANKIKAIDNEAKMRLQEAVREGRKIAEEIQSKSREQSKELLGQAKIEIQREVQEAKVLLKNELIDLTVATTSKLLESGIDQEQQKALVTKFLNDAELK